MRYTRHGHPRPFPHPNGHSTGKDLMVATRMWEVIRNWQGPSPFFLARPSMQGLYREKINPIPPESSRYGGLLRAQPDNAGYGSHPKVSLCSFVHWVQTIKSNQIKSGAEIISDQGLQAEYR